MEVDPRYYRPTGVHQLLGDAEKAREDLGWTPSTTLEEMAREMVTHDLEEAREDVVQRQSSFYRLNTRSQNSQIAARHFERSREISLK